jgi:hypothetical protein
LESLTVNKAIFPPSKNAPPLKNVASVRAIVETNYHFLRKALIAFGCSILLTASLVSVSRIMLIKLRATENQLQIRRDEIHSRDSLARTETMEIRDFQAKFIQLRARGFVGEEKRLDWIEHIKHIQAARNLLPLSYEISAQLPFQVDPSVLPADLELRGSKIKLHMDLLHEMDLFNFLEDLKSKVIYTSQACTINRAQAVVREDATSPTLTADCTLNWLTIGERVPAEAPTAVAN